MQNIATLPDEHLVAAYADGNNQAFDILLSRHQQRVFSHIMSLVKNRDVANDIFQDTFVRAITVIKQGLYNEEGKFGAWIYRIAHNMAIDHHRNNKESETLSVDDTDTDLLNRRDLSDGSAEDNLIAEQTADEMVGLVDILPDNQREIVNMRVYGDMSFKDIAKATNVSINTALGRMRYAVLNMRRAAAERDLIPA
ncbi:MAG: sigma-70 family RNA polymerase sigma factor [Pseudoflavonifractor sp.]|nr:sigma-70 family RNA polymerase sigma factor [Alloprevotella sp.]MCM1117227.1 sigma-70 family RNA polymerase sigma factor [Pseudoflavonifractor sp.]